MANELSNQRIAIFLSPRGTEQIEFVQPKQAAENAGAKVEVLSAATGSVQTVKHDLEPGDSFPVDKRFADARADDYDGLIVPGGSVGADTLRSNEAAVALVRAFASQGKPLAVICHGPWVLVEADLVRGKRLTSYPNLRTDVRNAGGAWVDQEVVVDNGIITSRNPDDLPAFCAAFIKAFSATRLLPHPAAP